MRIAWAGIVGFLLACSSPVPPAVDCSSLTDYLTRYYSYAQVEARFGEGEPVESITIEGHEVLVVRYQCIDKIDPRPTKVYVRLSDLSIEKWERE